MKQYSYIFLKPGLIPEQVAIQSAHVAMTLTQYLIDDAIDYNVSSLNYVMTPLSMPDADLFDELENMGIKYVEFIDFEYTFVDGKLTQSANPNVATIMTYPIDEDKRRWLRMLPLYRIK